MDLISRAFLALLLTGLALGGMAFFSFVFAPMVFRELPEEMAGRLIRRIFPLYYAVGCGLTIIAALLTAWSIAGLLLALVAVAFLFALLWLRPAINRARDKGLAGDDTAMATFRGLHHGSVALNGAQLVVLLVAFALLAIGWS